VFSGQASLLTPQPLQDIVSLQSLLWESIILSLPSPTCKAYPIRLPQIARLPFSAFVQVRPLTPFYNQTVRITLVIRTGLTRVDHPFIAPSFHCPTLPAKPTLFQYDCTFVEVRPLL